MRLTAEQLNELTSKRGYGIANVAPKRVAVEVSPHVTKGDEARRVNPQVFGTTEQLQGIIRDTVSQAGKQRLRQKTGEKLNKTETAFLEWLRARFPKESIRAQAVTLVLGNGVRYTPDFTSLKDGLAWETKGFMRDDAAVKIKIAASLYPEIRFHLVTKRKGGDWDIQVILP